MERPWVPLALLGLCWVLSGAAAERHTVFWNSSNLRLTWSDYAVEVRLNDYLDIICPHYEEGSADPRAMERYTLYLVEHEEYQACKPRSKEQIRWECNKPSALHGPEKFSEKFQRFTPFTLGKEFKEGHSYYYICERPRGLLWGSGGPCWAPHHLTHILPCSQAHSPPRGRVPEAEGGGRWQRGSDAARPHPEGPDPGRRRGRARSEERGAELGDTRQQPLHLRQPPRAPAGAAGAVSWGPGLGTQPGCSGTQWSLCRPRGGPPCVQARKGFVSIKGWKRPKLSSRSPR